MGTGTKSNKKGICSRRMRSSRRSKFSGGSDSEFTSTSPASSSLEMFVPNLSPRESRSRYNLRPRTNLRRPQVLGTSPQTSPRTAAGRVAKKPAVKKAVQKTIVKDSEEAGESAGCVSPARLPKRRGSANNNRLSGIRRISQRFGNDIRSRLRNTGVISRCRELRQHCQDAKRRATALIEQMDEMEQLVIEWEQEGKQGEREFGSEDFTEGSAAFSPPPVLELMVDLWPGTVPSPAAAPSSPPAASPSPPAAAPSPPAAAPSPPAAAPSPPIAAPSPPAAAPSPAAAPPSHAAVPTSPEAAPPSPPASPEIPDAPEDHQQEVPILGGLEEEAAYSGGAQSEGVEMRMVPSTPPSPSVEVAPVDDDRTDKDHMESESEDCDQEQHNDFFPLINEDTIAQVGNSVHDYSAEDSSDYHPAPLENGAASLENGFSPPRNVHFAPENLSPPEDRPQSPEDLSAPPQNLEDSIHMKTVFTVENLGTRDETVGHDTSLPSSSELSAESSFTLKEEMREEVSLVGISGGSAGLQESSTAEQPETKPQTFNMTVRGGSEMWPMMRNNLDTIFGSQNNVGGELTITLGPPQNQRPSTSIDSSGFFNGTSPRPVKKEVENVDNRNSRMPSRFVEEAEIDNIMPRPVNGNAAGMTPRSVASSSGVSMDDEADDVVILSPTKKNRPPTPFYVTID